MKITKHNVCETIEKFLKSLRIRFTTNSICPQGITYVLYIGSLRGHLQVEYNLVDPNDDEVIVQLFTELDNNGNSLYHYIWSIDDVDYSLETKIEELITEVKRINSVISKIRNRIKQIKDLCETNELDYENFISINYDFDK